jgi:hypothetical protein
MPVLHILTALATIWSLQQDGAPAIPPAECREWRQCRQMALEARDRNTFEAFHNLAWRAMQNGPPRDPISMYLLADAQTLSGRPHDALIMLGRLAEMGVKTDAATDQDFEAVRDLPGWPEVQRLIAALPADAPTVALADAHGGLPPAVPGRAPAKSLPAPTRVPANSAVTPSPPPPAAAAAPTPAVGGTSLRSQDAFRLTGTGLSPRGLAYDAVSSRFVVADLVEQKLVVIDERSQHVIDLVRASSAGFYEITALESDGQRGDLWVVSVSAQSADGTAGATALHRLQLVSGRPLDTVAVSDALKPARFTDVVVTAGGSVFVLDSSGRRIFRLQKDPRRLVVAATLKVDAPTSLATVDERVFYVAHADGVVRVDVSTGDVAQLRAPAGVSLTGFERIRWKRNALIGIQTMMDGSRRAVSIRVTGGRAVAAEVVQANVEMFDPTAATVSGSDFYFLTRQPGDGQAPDILVKRVRLP